MRAAFRFIYGNGSWRLTVYARNLASKMVNGSVWTAPACILGK